jgi:two-component system phosphate regulon sensor histidine kinase PhoR
LQLPFEFQHHPIIAGNAMRGYRGRMTDTNNMLLSFIDTPILLLNDDRVTFANQAAKNLLGQHIENQNVRLALRDPRAVQLIREGRDGTVQVTGLSVTGSVWEMGYHVLDGDNRMIALNDLSKQSSVARAHADFVANASHELRTPLTAILGYVETLKDAKAGADEQTRNRFLDIIGKEAARMQALVSDLMSLSRIEAVRHEAPTDSVELVALTREVIAEHPRDEAVSLDLQSDAVSVAGDKGQLGQAIRNLIDNAAKYGKSGKGVEVRIEASDRGWVTLAVVDHGEGIAPEHLPRLTERFYRTDTARSRAEGGTGLGLAIVKHIVERHRGRFDISSHPGAGTTAMIMLPTV